MRTVFHFNSTNENDYVDYDKEFKDISKLTDEGLIEEKWLYLIEQSKNWKTHPFSNMPYLVQTKDLTNFTPKNETILMFSRQLTQALRNKDLDECIALFSMLKIYSDYVIKSYSKQISERVKLDEAILFTIDNYFKTK